ncbi:hypothetical protein CR513_40988, partial [Mucuna pruriens]
MDKLGRPGKYSIAGSIGPPFSKTLINSSSPVKNAKKLEWPLANGMKCPNNPSCSAKFLMCRVIATKTNDAKVVVDFLKSNIFYRFGVLNALISDQGSHFYNRVMSSLLHKYGVNCIPNSVGDISLSYCLHKSLSSFDGNRTQSLLGRKQRKFQLQELDELCLEAYENSRISKQKVKQFHDQQILRKEFQVDQRVLLFNSCLKIIVSKLCSRWDEPFLITNVFPYGVVNGHQIKLFHEGPAPIVGDMETISLMEPAPSNDTP